MIAVRGAIPNWSNQTVDVLLGNGDGTFKPAITAPIPASPSGITAGDFNKDGNLDLAATAYWINGASTVGGVAVLLGKGDGTFAPYVIYPIYYDGNYYGDTSPVSPMVADVNMDGIPDLLIALQYTHAQANYLPAPNLGLAVFLGNGDGTFTPETGGPFVLAGPYGPFLAGEYSWGLAVGDFNRDGAPDVAVLNNDANNILSYVTVLLNSTAPVSASPDSITYAARTEGTVSPAQTVVFTNNGSAPLAIGTIALGGADPEDFSFTSACGTSLLAGDSVRPIEPSVGATQRCWAIKAESAGQ
jgi:hypothetical protein